MQNAVVIPPSLQFHGQDSILPTETSYVEFSPISGTEWASNEVATININSSSDLLDPSRSFLKYDLLLTTPNTAGSLMSSSNGLVSAISSIRTTLGGQVIETIDNYNNYASITYKRYPSSYKSALARLEHLGDTDVISGDANQRTYGAKCCHSLLTGLMSGNKQIPLPWCRGGLSLDITVAPFEQVLAVNAAVATGVKIKNLRFVACLVKPSQEYLKSFNESLASGSVAKLPVSLTKSYRWVPSSLTSQTRTLNVGFLKSVSDILITHRTSSALSSAAADSFVHHNATAKSFSFRIAGNVYPKNFSISCNNDDTTAAISPEALMFEMLSVDNSYALFDTPTAITANTANAIYYNFQNQQQQHGTGVSVEDGALEVVTDYISSPAAYTCDCYLRFDAVVEVSATNVALNTRSF